MKPFKILGALLYMAISALAVCGLFDVPFVPTYGVIVTASFVMPTGAAFMGLQREIWRTDIVNNLYKDNQFAKRCINADQFVLAGKVVHIPVAGNPAQTAKNLTSFPQTATNRTDSELTYALDTTYSLPRQIQDIEKYELSYDKRQSVVGEDQQKLIQDTMDNLLWRWAPAAARVIETTGAGSGTDLIDGTATGLRKLFTKDAFKDIVKKLKKTNNGGKITALLTTEHYYQFFESLSDSEKTEVGRVADLATGLVGKYMGIEILMRSTVLRYRKVSNVWTVIDEQADGFAAGTGDSAASLFWVDNAVEAAIGEVHVFDDVNNPLYYGDIYSAYIRSGGRIRRTNAVYAVVEAITT